jgi:dTDP-4-amino-4,6-dideoxygalactose transaminase
MRKIKFGDIRIGDVARNHINECLDSNYVTCGPKSEELSKKWANLFNTKYSVGTSCGSSADLCALLSLYKFGAKRGQKVIVPGLSFIATASSVLYSGFSPLYCDVGLDSLVIDENKLEDLVKQNPDCVAIMPVTLMGRVYNAQAVLDIARKYNLFIITDNCEGAGCRYDGQFIEHYSHMSTMSFYSAHLCFSVQRGEVSTNDEELKNALLSVRSHGRKPNSLYFEHDLLGSNFMPTDLHACIGLEQAELFWETFNLRKENWYRIRKGLSEFEDLFHFCDEADKCVNSPHAFSLTFRKDKGNIKGFATYLENHGIETKRNFGAMYTHKGIAGLGFNENCPNAEYVGSHGIHFGTHRYMTEEDCEYVVKTIKDYIHTGWMTV